jgi:hypothetical protein
MHKNVLDDLPTNRRTQMPNGQPLLEALRVLGLYGKSTATEDALVFGSE